MDIQLNMIAANPLEFRLINQFFDETLKAVSNQSLRGRSMQRFRNLPCGTAGQHAQPNQ
jgi:hypothetical protein